MQTKRSPHNEGFPPFSAKAIPAAAHDRAIRLGHAERNVPEALRFSNNPPTMLQMKKPDGSFSAILSALLKPQTKTPFSPPLLMNPEYTQGRPHP